MRILYGIHSRRFSMRPLVLTVSLFAAVTAAVWADDPTRHEFRELRAFKAEHAHQAVAVDAAHFYAVNNRSVAKYDKQTGEFVSQWTAKTDSDVRHLNSGVVVDGRLHCAHSNWPVQPYKNTVEVLDATSMRHMHRHEITARDAALTWVDRYDGRWWAVLARYGEFANVQHTRLVEFDDNWQPRAAWLFPDEVIRQFVPYSNSGGSWGPDGLLYVTGHDRREMYLLRLPQAGNTKRMERVDIVSAPISGQGIAWDRSEAGTVYGIRRKSKEVVVSRRIAPRRE